MRIVLLGPPGSGKGTQGTVLAERLGVPHVSSGDLLRQHVADRTELGVRVSSYLEGGELVPTDLVLEVIGAAVAEAMRSGGYVLDGFPRSLEQAERAFALAQDTGSTADRVLYLSVADDIVRERLKGRAEQEGRVDDADDEVVERRLRVFHQETEPLLDFYRGRDILVTIDAAQPPDAVTESIFANLPTPA